MYRKKLNKKVNKENREGRLFEFRGKKKKRKAFSEVKILMLDQNKLAYFSGR